MMKVELFDHIHTRIKELEVQRRQLQANLFAVDGAIQDCEYWLVKLKDQTQFAQDTKIRNCVI